MSIQVRQNLAVKCGTRTRIPDLRFCQKDSEAQERQITRLLMDVKISDDDDSDFDLKVRQYGDSAVGEYLILDQTSEPKLVILNKKPEWTRKE